MLVANNRSSLYNRTGYVVRSQEWLRDQDCPLYTSAPSSHLTSREPHTVHCITAVRLRTFKISISTSTRTHRGASFLCSWADETKPVRLRLLVLYNIKCIYTNIYAKHSHFHETPHAQKSMKTPPYAQNTHQDPPYVPGDLPSCSEPTFCCCSPPGQLGEATRGLSLLSLVPLVSHTLVPHDHCHYHCFFPSFWPRMTRPGYTCYRCRLC